MNFFTKRLNKKGFTLAELLIVVAIIAILVAIAVPIFTNQMKKARIARDEANVRSAKAIAINWLLSDADDAVTALSTKTSWTFDVKFTANTGDPVVSYNSSATSGDTAAAAAKDGTIKYNGSETYTITVKQTDVTP